MEREIYSITDLEQLTGLSRRTIHFYIQEKVIPPSEGTGGSAKYSEEHVLRLALVKQMQESHLKLAGIKEKLAGLSLEDLRELSKMSKKRQSSHWDRESLKKWLTDEREPKIMYSLKSAAGALDEAPRYSLKKSDSLAPDSQTTKERTWKRIEIAEGVEMNVRSDIAHENEEDLKAIVEKLRQIMKGASFGR